MVILTDKILYHRKKKEKIDLKIIFLFGGQLHNTLKILQEELTSSLVHPQLT